MASVISARPWRLPQHHIPPAVVALGVAALVGAIVPIAGAATAAAVLAATALIVTARWPELWLLALVALTSTVFQYSELPRVGTVGASLYAPEVLLLALVGWSVARWLSGKSSIKEVGPTGVLIAALLVATAVSLLVGVYQGRPFQQEITAARFMAFYALYFPARQLVARRPAFSWLLVGLLALAGLTAVIYDLVVVTPVRGVLVNYPWFGARIESLYINTQYDAIQGGRVYMPGRALIQLMLFPSLVLALTLPPGTVIRRVTLGLTLLLLLSIILIFTRAVWLTTLLALVLLAGLAAGQLRRKLLRLMSAGLAVAVVAVVFTSMFDESNELSPLTIVWNRFSTIIADNINDENVAYRVLEARLVLERVQDDLVAGAGFGTPVSEQWAFDPLRGDYGYANVFAYHDGYLSLLLYEGLIGLVPFLALCVLVFAYVFRRWGEPLAVLTLVGGLGFGVSIVRVLVNGVTESTFNDSFTVPLLVISLAFLEYAMSQRSRRSQPESRLP